MVVLFLEVDESARCLLSRNKQGHSNEHSIERWGFLRHQTVGQETRLNVYWNSSKFTLHSLLDPRYNACDSFLEFVLIPSYSRSKADPKEKERQRDEKWSTRRNGERHSPPSRNVTRPSIPRSLACVKADIARHSAGTSNEMRAENAKD